MTINWNVVEVAKKKKCRQEHDESSNYNWQQQWQLQLQLHGLPLQDNTLSYTARTTSSFDPLHGRRPQMPIRQKQRVALACSGWPYRQSHKSCPQRVVTVSQSATALPPSCKLYARVFRLSNYSTQFPFYALAIGLGLGLGLGLSFGHSADFTLWQRDFYWTFFFEHTLFFAAFPFVAVVLRSLLKLFVSCLWHLSCYLFNLLFLLFNKAPSSKKSEYSSVPFVFV